GGPPTPRSQGGCSSARAPWTTTSGRSTESSTSPHGGSSVALCRRRRRPAGADHRHPERHLRALDGADQQTDSKTPPEHGRTVLLRFVRHVVLDRPVDRPPAYVRRTPLAGVRLSPPAPFGQEVFLCPDTRQEKSCRPSP